MNNTLILLSRIIFILALLLPVIFLFFILKGFYFSGDTVSFLQYGTNVLKLHFWDVFLIHGNQWPPLPAMFYNVLQILPGGFNTEQKAYLIIFFFLNLSACYFLIKNYFANSYQRIIITSILLFSGAQILLLKISLADVQFMAMWLWSLVFLDRFIQTKKEKYAALYIIPASLIPMTRYAGIPVTLTLSAILLIFSFRNFQKGKFSIYFIILAAFFTLLPISLYLFRNVMATHAIFGYYDPQFKGITFTGALWIRIQLILNDIALPFLITLILGTKLPWRKNYFLKILIFILPIIIYLLMIIMQQLQYRLIDFIPSRYNSPFYPILLLTGLLTGSWLATKFLIIKKVPNISILIVTLLLFGATYYSSFKYFFTELGFAPNQIPETDYSQNLLKFCNLANNHQRYLFLQYDSRNWSAQGLYFFCKPITWIAMTEEKITLPAGSAVFSPYELSDPKLVKINIYYGRRNINLYQAKEGLELNIKQELSKLDSILQ